MRQPLPIPVAESGQELAIDVSSVSKTYRGKTRALIDVDLRVHKAEVFGLLGPNGAGKSTLVKVLMTIVRADSCRGTVLGRPVGHKPTLARVGYLPEQHKFPEYLTAFQALDFFAAMSGMQRADRRARASELLDLVDLSRVAHKRVRTFSKGMRQRLGVAQAIMHRPTLVLLDEPTDGVDPVGRVEIRKTLLRCRDQGMTVFLNSHLLSEMEAMCDRAAIAVKGRIVAQGPVAELSSYGRRYEIELAAPDGLTDATRAALREAVESIGQLDPRPVEPNPDWRGPDDPPTAPASAAPRALRGTVRGAIPVELQGLTVKIGSDNAVHVQPLLDAARARNLTIRAVRPVRPTLEELFMRALADPAPAAAPGSESGPTAPAPAQTREPHA